MQKRKISRKKKLLILFGSILIVLIAARLVLPYFVLRWVNRELARIDGYRGHVEDIDIALIRGAYTIKKITLDKTGGKIPVPFFSADAIDLSVEWKAIFDGAFVGEIVVDRPKLNFVKGPSETTSQTKVDKDWIDVVDNLMPLKLNRLEINNGEIHYRDFHSSPKVDIYSKNIQVLAENLNNSKDKKELLPSTVRANADVYGGKANLYMKLDPLNRQTTFDANAELTNLQLTELNDFLKAYGNFDVSSGSLSLYTEVAAKQDRIAGYTKPIIKDLKVINWKEDKDKPLKLLWEGLLEGVAFIFKNHPKDQIATKAEFEGNIDNPDTNTWEIIGQVLRNAFIEALYPSLENEVNIGSVSTKKDEPKTVLGKAFEKISGGEEKKSKREERKEKRKERREDRKKKKAEKVE